MDEPATRDLILDAAERLFARQGFERTTIKQLAGEAGVNSALLYYYYGDKERLYRAVLARLIGGIARGAAGRLQPGLPADEAVRAFVHGQAESLIANPHFPRLVGRELIDHDAEHAEEQIRSAVATGFRKLCEVIEEGQRAGIFRDDVDPRFAAISTVGQVAYFFLARPVVGAVLGHGPGGAPPEVARAFADHAADFAVAALAVPVAKPARGTRRTR